MDLEATIHTIEVPVNAECIDRAGRWLAERLGEPGWKSKPRTNEHGDVAFDASRIYMEDVLWDAYVNPSSFRAFFLIKENDNLAMLFKLTFGGQNAD